MNKKRLLFIIIFVIIIGLGILITVIQKDDSPPHIPQEQDEETTESEQTEEDENSEEEEEENKITRNIRNVVQEALNLFQNDTHIVAIGDSLTQGVGDETGNDGYVGIIEERFMEQDYSVTFDNFGKRGNRTDHLLKRLEDNPEITATIEEADIILLTIGANDLMQIMKDNFMNLVEEPFLADLDPYGERLATILERMHKEQPEAEIYLLGFFNPFEQYFQEIEELNHIVTLWNNKSLEVANQYDYVNFIPMQDIFQGAEEDVFSEDNFHPNHRGYEIIAERVISFLQNKMEENQQ